MNNSLKTILKNHLNNKQYSEYNEILRQEIISLFVKKIKIKDPSFLYSTMIELSEYVENNLTEEDSLNFRYFYDLLKKDYNPEVLAEYITDLYKKIEN